MGFNLFHDLKVVAMDNLITGNVSYLFLLPAWLSAGNVAGRQLFPLAFFPSSVLGKTSCLINNILVIRREELAGY